MLKHILMASALIGASISTAYAQAFPCPGSPSGWCMPAPPPHHERFRVGGFVPGLVAGAAIGTEQTLLGEGNEYRAIAPRVKGPCPLGGNYVPETRKCDISGEPTPDIQEDPQCRDQPPGTRFDVPITGPHGERGVDHRVCGVRPD